MKICPCESLEAVRTEIDRIDQAIVQLIAERGEYVSQAARFKNSTADVKAPQRVEQVIAKALANAEECGASRAVVEAVYRSMISAFIEVELSRYASTKTG